MTEGLQGYVNFAIGDSLFLQLEARESALIHSLIYIIRVLGYTIGDLRYTNYLILQGEEPKSSVT